MSHPRLLVVLLLFLLLFASAAPRGNQKATVKTPLPPVAPLDIGRLLELQRGDAGKAHDLAQASLDQRRADVDPWRLFLYGHHPRLAGLIAELRRQVKP